VPAGESPALGTTRMRTSRGVLLLSLVLAACSNVSQTTTQPRSPAEASQASEPSASDGRGLTYVALGDSWVEGAHCGGCRTFAGLYADGLEVLTGESVEFVDLTGDRTTDSTALLDSLRTDDEIRAAVADADVVLIATGPNEGSITTEPLATGTCGGPDNLDCIRALGDRWATNFDSAIEEIEQLRDGKPTAIRLVNAANFFTSDPSIAAGLGLDEDFASTAFALNFELLTEAVCGAAEAHRAKCLDVRPILNGPNLDRPTDENSPENMQAIADALVDIGLPELK
jgi:lysophospholipase L1-like esterase